MRTPERSDLVSAGGSGHEVRTPERPDPVSQRVLIVGLRATGAAVVRAAVRRGDSVTVVEDDPGQRAYASRVAEARDLGATIVERPAPEAWTDLVAGADLMVPSPGVRPQHPAFVAAIAAGIPVRGDIDLGMEAARVPVVAVTGTNGKSTVTTLITAILNASGVRADAAGNIGRPLLDVVEEPWDVIVAEISSFQLHTTTAAFRPRVAVLLNVAEDHLDWHGSFVSTRRSRPGCSRTSGTTICSSRTSTTRSCERWRRLPRRAPWESRSAPPRPRTRARTDCS